MPTRLAPALAALGLWLASPAALTAEEAPQAPVKSSEYRYQTPKLHRAEIDALLAKPGSLLVIDVRRPDEISAIGGFPVYLNLQPSGLEAALPYLPKDRAIVTVSNHAARAGTVGDQLAAKGFKVVGAIGAQNYEEEGGSLFRVAPPPPKSP